MNAGELREVLKGVDDDVPVEVLIEAGNTAVDVVNAKAGMFFNRRRFMLGTEPELWKAKDEGV